MTKAKSGWIYVLSNPAIPDLVKVGFTEADPETRAKELDATGVPQPFVVEHGVLVGGAQALERRVHRYLDAVRER